MAFIVKVWAEVIGPSEIPTDRLNEAYIEAARTHEGFGMMYPAGIIRAYSRLTESLRPSALEVWGATMKELAESMREMRPAKLDPDVKKLVDALGGRKLILDESKPAIIRAQFLKAYERNQEAGRTPSGALEAAK